ncbi:DUF1700 domain-containing protein [Alicyclobacillus acidoterrestris]|uniref:DUF1700 domain-containing protein n=1 Tax=Alicyclobacillus acidoterrestris TaxID=1450 RepID=UPI000386AF5D|nr:DUF1700 domain-containing protein [Alicyclobacillus acidoterrestris]EPZ43287.1 hypothetical protein N007_13395 [Alicyclobacillus acidoterrestris ATCC 49025]
MTTQAFLEALNRLLRKLPSTDRKEILSDYEEHIHAAKEHGKTEDAILNGLGDPKNRRQGDYGGILRGTR